MQHTFKRLRAAIKRDGITTVVLNVVTFILLNNTTKKHYVRFVNWYRRTFSFSQHRHPYIKLIEVDPTSIKKASGREYNICELGKTYGGDWDCDCKSLQADDLFTSIKQRYTEGIEWEVTEFYNRNVSEISKGKEKYGCRTEKEFKQRCADIDALCESIQQNGYLRGCDRQNLKNDPMNKTTRKNYLNNAIDEVKVDIGRDGELLHADGSHRLAIAKALELETIPVLIFRRHEQWQQVIKNRNTNKIKDNSQNKSNCSSDGDPEYE